MEASSPTSAPSGGGNLLFFTLEKMHLQQYILTTSNHNNYLVTIIIIHIVKKNNMTNQNWSTIRITVDNSSNNTVGGSCHPTHQAAVWFSQDHRYIISWVHCKRQTGVCVSVNINKSFNCVNITDSDFPDDVY